MKGSRFTIRKIYTYHKFLQEAKCLNRCSTLPLMQETVTCNGGQKCLPFAHLFQMQDWRFIKILHKSKKFRRLLSLVTKMNHRWCLYKLQCLSYSGHMQTKCTLQIIMPQVWKCICFVCKNLVQLQAVSCMTCQKKLWFPSFWCVVCLWEPFSDLGFKNFHLS